MFFTKKEFCTSCHTTAKPLMKGKGSMGMELTLWVVFIGVTVMTMGVGFMSLLIPLIYSLYRLFGAKQKLCPSCKNPTMIPTDSPAAKVTG